MICCSAKIQPLINRQRNIGNFERFAELGAKPRGFSIEEVRTNERARFLQESGFFQRGRTVYKEYRGLRTKRGHGTGGRNRNWNNWGIERRDWEQFTGQSLSYYRYRIATRATTAAFPPPSWTNVCAALPWTDSGATLDWVLLPVCPRVHHTYIHAYVQASRWSRAISRGSRKKLFGYLAFGSLHPFACTKHFLRQCSLQGGCTFVIRQVKRIAHPASWLPHLV